MTGSLQEKNGIYQMVINLKDANGKRKPKWISTGLPIKGNKRKAEQMLNTLLVEYSEGNYTEPSKLLFCDFLKNWVEMNRPKLQDTTYTNYIYLIEKHICPYFKVAKLKLVTITPDSIQQYYNAKMHEGLSPNTVIKHHAIIHSALKYAVKSRLIKENPCDFVERPKAKKFVAKFCSASEIKDLLSVMESAVIRGYAERVSQMMNIPISWLNTGGSLSVTKQMLDRTVKGIELSNLTVWFFDWKVMLVQKISASREQPDITDAVAIIRKYNVKDLDEVDSWMKELQDKWYSMSSRYKAKNMLDIAWNTEDTSYSLLRTALDTKGYRDKTVDYYAQLILADLGITQYDDMYETALAYFDEWLLV